MAKETKIGLALCVLLIGAFAFVVYSKMNNQRLAEGSADSVANSGEKEGDDSKGVGKTGTDSSADDSDGDHGNAFTAKHQEKHRHILPQQQAQVQKPLDSQQQLDPWARQQTPRQPTTGAINVSQPAQQTENPFNTARNQSPAQTTQHEHHLHDDAQYFKEPNERDESGTAQQTKQDDFDIFIDRDRRDDIAQQAIDDTHSHHTHPGRDDQRQTYQQQEQRTADEFDPFADEGTESHTHQEQMPAGSSQFLDPQRTVDDDIAQQSRYGTADDQSGQFDPFDRGSSDDDRFNTSQAAETQAGSATNVYRSTDTDTDADSEWTQQSSPYGRSDMRQQSALPGDERDGEFDPFVPADQSAQRSFHHHHSATTQSASSSPFPDHDAGTRSFQGGFDGHPHSKTGRPASDMSDDRPAVYVVGSGDNFWNISKKQYGAGRYYQALALYNRRRIPDPQKMRPGMKVLVPDSRILESRFPELFPQRTAASTARIGGGGELPGFFTPAEGAPLYRVGADDTLTGIAKNHLGRASRWLQVYALNRDRIADPGRLKIGTVLHLPVDASRVQLVRNPRNHR